MTTSQIRMMVDDEKLREEVKKRQQASDVDAAKTSATLLDAVRNESLANWVLSRLSFESGIGITINKLSNDPYDGDAVVPEPAVFEVGCAPKPQKAEHRGSIGRSMLATPTE